MSRDKIPVLNFTPKKSKLIFWNNGDQGRALQMYRPCDCGTCQKEAREEGYVGYLSGSDEHGEGFTLFVYDENAYFRLYHQFGGEKPVSTGQSPNF